MFYRLRKWSRKTNFTTRQGLKQTNSTKEYALNNIIEAACWLRDPYKKSLLLETIQNKKGLLLFIHSLIKAL